MKYQNYFEQFPEIYENIGTWNSSVLDSPILYLPNYEHGHLRHEVIKDFKNIIKVNFPENINYTFKTKIPTSWIRVEKAIVSINDVKYHLPHHCFGVPKLYCEHRFYISQHGRIGIVPKYGIFPAEPKNLKNIDENLMITPIEWLDLWLKQHLFPYPKAIENDYVLPNIFPLSEVWDYASNVINYKNLLKQYLDKFEF